MSYTPPNLSAIDLTGAGGFYSPPSLGSIDLSGAGGTPSDPIGTIDAALNFSANFSGYMQPVGEISAALQITAEFYGGDSVWGSLDAELSFSADFSGQTADTFGSIDAVLDFSFSGRGFQDWAANLPANILQTFYTLTITGNPDLVVPISSWQATLREGARSDYLQAVMPAAQNIADAISARSGGRLLVSKGYRFDDGSERSEVIVESDFSTIRVDRGSVNFTITVSGYIESKAAQSASRKLNGVRSLSVSNGSYRARSDIDLFLRPGMTAEVLGEEFQVSYINFYASRVDQFCDVGSE